MSTTIINEVCASGNGSQVKNLGGKQQCIEGAVITAFLAKEDFYFESIIDAKDKAKILEAIGNKNLVPLPTFETVEDENTEATIVEKRTRTIVTKEGVAGSRYGIDASMCTYAALKTYQNSNYTRIFEITDADDEEMTCDIIDGKVYGRKLTSTIVNQRTRTNLENDANVPLSLKFDEDTYSIIKTGGGYDDIEGVFDVAINQVSASSTEIKVSVTTDCSGTNINSFEDGNLVVKDATGAVQSVTFTEADAGGVYTITGTGFADGFTVELNGVVLQGEKHYEAATALTLASVA